MRGVAEGWKYGTSPSTAATSTGRWSERATSVSTGKYLRDPTLLEYQQVAREAGLGLCALPEALASAHVGCEPVNRLIQVGSSHYCYGSLSGNRGASP